MRSTSNLFLVGLISVLAAGILAAQGPTGAQRMKDRISREVRHELVMLPQFTIFDNLQYKIDGATVTLLGQVNNAVLKYSAEKVVRKIEGVEQVKNQIEVLPASSGDDRLRRAIAHALFAEDSPLFRYSLGSVPPIHIVVKNGRVALEGVVDNQSDKNLAYMRAGAVPGVLSVENHLQVQTP